MSSRFPFSLSFFARLWKQVSLSPCSFHSWTTNWGKTKIKLFERHCVSRCVASITCPYLEVTFQLRDRTWRNRQTALVPICYSTYRSLVAHMASWGLGVGKDRVWRQPYLNELIHFLGGAGG
ncbi:uncharacterized protein PV06_10909 [Exophiala oligosperma]|uniref:Secreted protein n=1 Tax=Exophiala oligosperma TaxID=215243 RepID=A0A0D2BHZ5_9EURO|nr:uncharacterized protein PV06_10909 [Exophiala oligosperma]KIW37012.1 hypothetical protein PV06_10909 [Exophiala oligosperma]